MGIEQRHAARYSVEVAAEVYTPGAVLPAKTRNLSETGVCFDLDAPLAEDATVGVSLFLVSDGIEDPDAEPLNVKASVVWCSDREDGGASAGMRFVDVDARCSQVITHFLSQLG
jgi:hypothetical protein